MLKVTVQNYRERTLESRNGVIYHVAHRFCPTFEKLRFAYVKQSIHYMYALNHLSMGNNPLHLKMPHAKGAMGLACQTTVWLRVVAW